MQHPTSFGFIGFGEAGFELARGLHSAGISPIYFFDAAARDPAQSKRILDRAGEAGAVPLGSIGEAVKKAGIILSLVPPGASLAVAREAIPHLDPGKMYLDLTSSFPDDMKTISGLIRPTGARFVDGAMMGALPIFRHKVLIYVSGPHAREAAGLLNHLGMNLQEVGREPGDASAVKLILSVSTKGLEALLVEMLLAAHHYRLEEPVLAAFCRFFAKGPEAAVDRLVGSDAVHSGRRVMEMESSVRLLKSLGIDPMMSQATVQRLQWSASLGLKEYFKGVSPQKYQEVIKAWEAIGLFSGRKDR